MDLEAEKWDNVISRIQPIVEANKAALDADTIAWSEYVVGEALAGGKNRTAALDLFKKIVEGSNVSADWRGWGIYRATKTLSDLSAPAAALAYAEKGLNLDSTAAPLLYGLYASIAIGSHSPEHLRTQLEPVPRRQSRGPGGDPARHHRRGQRSHHQRA